MPQRLLTRSYQAKLLAVRRVPSPPESAVTECLLATCPGDSKNYAIRRDYAAFTVLAPLAVPHGWKPTLPVTLAQIQYSAKSEIFVFPETSDKFSRSHVI